MSDTVISVEHVSKQYRLGVIGTGTFKDDLKIWTARMRGKPNPLAKVGEVDYGNRSGDTIMALDDVSFTVKQGEALGIIGRNGAGKSTLLKILSRVTTPTSGKIKVKGRIASLLEVGTGFHPELTGRENIYLNGAILGMTRKEIDRKFDEIVDFSGVEKFIDTPVKRYSSGMYVRLAFAVAAHLDPEILIVDEVLAVGDAEFQKKCLGKMGDVANEGRTVLFVSHNMGAISMLCKRAILFEKGRLVESGECKNVISAYTNQNIFHDEPFKHCTHLGNGQIQITSVTFESANGEKKEVFQSGETIVIVIGYKNNCENLKNKYSFGFSFHSQEGIGILNNYSHFSNMYYTNLPKEGNVKCIIERNQFVPKQYMLGFRIVMNGDQNYGEEVDWPDILVPIKIIDGDFYKTDNHVLSDWGYFLIDGRWLPIQ